jgi:NAD(P)H-nitrite reductase large subunit
MSKIVILGSSVAGVKAAEELLSNNSSHSITIIAYDGYYPYDKELFPELLSEKIQASEIFYKAQDFYAQKGIELILDKKVTRVNFGRKKIFCEDRTQIDFDILIIAESVAHRFSEIKGSHRQGLFGMKKLKDIETIMKEMPFFSTVAIQSDQFSGIRMAQAFVDRGKEVILVSSGNEPYLGTIEEEMLEKLNEGFAEKKLSIVSDNGVTELLGEKDIKAIRLTSGKVLATNFFIMGDAPEDLRTFADQDLKTGRGICVDESFRTNIENIYAIDVFCEGDLVKHKEDLASREFLEFQGSQISQGLLGGSIGSSPENPLVKEISLEGVRFTFIGKTNKADNVDELFLMKEELSYEKVFIKEGNIIGAMLINSQDQTEKFTQIIQERASLKSVESYLLERNYTYNDIESILKGPEEAEEHPVLQDENTVAS